MEVVILIVISVNELVHLINYWLLLSLRSPVEAAKWTWYLIQLFHFCFVLVQ